MDYANCSSTDSHCCSQLWFTKTTASSMSTVQVGPTVLQQQMCLLSERLFQAIFSINPIGGWSNSYDAQLVLLCAFFLAFLVGMLQFLSPRYTQAYMCALHSPTLTGHIHWPCHPLCTACHHSLITTDHITSTHQHSHSTHQYSPTQPQHSPALTTTRSTRSWPQ